MRIAELASRSGTSAASIKHYAREGLLAGDRVGYNRTDYAEHHVARLRLISALLHHGGLSVAGVRDVLAAIDDEALPIEATMAVAQHALPRRASAPSAASVAAVRAAVDERGWCVEDDNPGIALAAATLDRYREIGRDDLARITAEHLDAAASLAAADLRLVAESGSRDRMAETVVVGTVLGDALNAGLRRIAQEHRARTGAQEHGARTGADGHRVRTSAAAAPDPVD